jgi:hypothetical protein
MLWIGWLQLANDHPATEFTGKGQFIMVATDHRATGIDKPIIFVYNSTVVHHLKPT